MTQGHAHALIFLPFSNLRFAQIALTLNMAPEKGLFVKIACNNPVDRFTVK